MTLLRALRVLVLGETWVLPIGVPVTLGSAAVLHAAAPALWQQLGGLFLTLAVIAVLTVAVGVGRRADRR